EDRFHEGLAKRQALLLRRTFLAGPDLVRLEEDDGRVDGKDFEWAEAVGRRGANADQTGGVRLRIGKQPAGDLGAGIEFRVKDEVSRREGEDHVVPILIVESAVSVPVVEGEERTWDHPKSGEIRQAELRRLVQDRKAQLSGVRRDGHVVAFPYLATPRVEGLPNETDVGRFRFRWKALHVDRDDGDRLVFDRIGTRSDGYARDQGEGSIRPDPHDRLPPSATRAGLACPWTREVPERASGREENYSVPLQSLPSPS